MSPRKAMTAIYADRSSRQWVVRDPDGAFWTIPAAENAWENRQPYFPTDETVLEPVPGHYKHLLGIPI